MAKSIIFVCLFTSFIIYSITVYTKGTQCDTATMNEQAIDGKLLYQKYNCTACHQLYGLGGYLGPELTTVISSKEKGEIFARALLQSGSQRMPDFHLNNSEIDNLLEYLKYVDKTAITYKER